MKIRQVTYFLALCEEQSFTRAARRCGVAQPSLTRAIQLLEQEIGGRLFERSNSSVRLTELGALVHPDFVRISQSTESIERNAASLLASSLDAPDQRLMEGFTRALSIGAATISILAAGLALHPTPQATALESAQAGAHADPVGLQSEGDGHSLPTQKTEDFFDACSGMAPDRRKLWLARTGLFDRMDGKNCANRR
ncbi:MAG: LysR family transcriptional regulator [Pseudolabrys sp.]